MEPSKENHLEKRYFQFAGDLQKLDHDEFQSEEKIIPSIGTVRLFLSRAYGYEPGEMGITFVNNKLVIDQAENLYQDNKYQLDIFTLGPNKSIACFVLLGSHSQELLSTIVPNEDTNQKNPFKRFNGISQEWAFEDDEVRYTLFSPADPDFVRNLKFRFEIRD